MRFAITMIDADGNAVGAPPGDESPDLIGAIVQTPKGNYIAISLAPEPERVNGNLGVYETFELAVGALRENHRRE
jgi:hypothetical protein